MEIDLLKQKPKPENNSPFTDSRNNCDVKENILWPKNLTLICDHDQHQVTFR